MSNKCPYVVTKVHGKDYRCYRETKGKLLCPMHREIVLKVLDAVNDELIAALRKDELCQSK